MSKIPVQQIEQDKSSANYRLLVLPRFSIFWLVIVLTIVGLYLANWWLFAICLFLTGVGLHDITQKRHAVLRNYPIAGHIRFLLENFRPEIRQYFLESDEDEVPFSRQQRSIVYQRAKDLESTTAFGSIKNLNEVGSEWFLHSGNSHKIKNSDFRVRVGNERCTQPYDLSIFNISAMSFGALSAAAIEALNK